MQLQCCFSHSLFSGRVLSARERDTRVSERERERERQYTVCAHARGRERRAERDLNAPRELDASRSAQCVKALNVKVAAAARASESDALTHLHRTDFSTDSSVSQYSHSDGFILQSTAEELIHT